MKEFYCLESITYKPQPIGSNWCWAACLSNFINNLDSISNIGVEQCDLVNYYKKYLKKVDNSFNYDEENCCPENLKNSCNIGMNDKHFPHILKKIGFECDTYETIQKLNSFDFIVKTLKENLCPIVVKTKTSVAHDILITGYGSLGDCKYIFISDPSRKYDEIYFDLENFREKIKYAEKYWI